MMNLKHVITFCNDQGGNCPKLYLNETAEESKTVVMTDDFGQKIEMSKTQFSVIAESIKNNTFSI